MIIFKILKPTRVKAIASFIFGVILFFILSSSCGRGFPDGGADFPCDTDLSRNVVTSFFGLFFVIYPLLYFLTILSIKKQSVVKAISNASILGIFLTGVLSGLLSFYSINLKDNFISFSPGIIFGVIIGTYFFLFKKVKSWFRLILFIITSGIAYFIAFLTGNFAGIMFAIGNPASLVVIPILAGCVGSILLLGGFHFFIYKLTGRQFKILLVLGSILSLSMYIIPNGVLFQSDAEIAHFPANWLFSLFLFWQTGIATALGLTVFPKRSN